MTISRAYALEHFDEICERAENGEEIVLERPGRAGLALVPQGEIRSGGSSPEAVKAMLDFMDSQPKHPGAIDYRALISEGRRF